MLEHDLLVFTRKLTELGAPYMITGSWATSLYGQPRMTRDVDIVVHLEANQVGRLRQLFPEDDFYCPPASLVLKEMQRPTHGQFNIIHNQSGSKADLYVSREDPLDAWGFSLARTFKMTNGETIVVAPPEYIILRKLEFYQRGASEKHLLDIRGVLETLADEIDLPTLEARIRQMGLAEAWKKIRSS